MNSQWTDMKKSPGYIVKKSSCKTVHIYATFYEEMVCAENIFVFIGISIKKFWNGIQKINPRGQLCCRVGE